MRNKLIVGFALVAVFIMGSLFSNLFKFEVPVAKAGTNGTAWEKVKVSKGPDIRRLNVVGGWLVLVTDGTGNGIAFMPDPNHQWQ